MRSTFRPMVAGPTHPQDFIAVAHTVQSYGVGCLLDGAELHKGKTLVVVDVARHHGVPSSTCRAETYTPEQLLHAACPALHRHNNSTARTDSAEKLCSIHF